MDEWSKGLCTGAALAVAVFSFANLIFGPPSQRELIQRGLAEYCAADGRFAFKGECK